jgi:hypothetical protein
MVVGAAWSQLNLAGPCSSPGLGIVSKREWRTTVRVTAPVGWGRHGRGGCAGYTPCERRRSRVPGLRTWRVRPRRRPAQLRCANKDGVAAPLKKRVRRRTVEVGGGRVGFGGGKGRERSICAGFGLLAVGWGLGYLTSTSTVGVQGNFGQIGARFERASKIFAKERRENRR